MLTTVAPQAPPAARHIALVLLVTGALGAGVGLVTYQSQDAVEQAQVLAGLVRYPPQDPTYVYSARLWNLWAQLATLCLLAGCTEAAVSLLFSMMAGVLTAWGFALWTLALTRDAAFSILAPFVCIVILSGLFWDMPGYIRYPIMMFGFPHTYGMLSPSFVLVLMATLALGASRCSFFLLGLSVCVHPSIGLWANLMILLAVASDHRHWRAWLGPARYVALGYALSGVSFLVQRLAYPVPALPVDVVGQYLSAFLQHWDYHRTAVNIATLVEPIGLVILANTTCIAAAALACRTEVLPSGQSLALRAVLMIPAIGLGFTAYAQTGLLASDLIAVLLPARFMNLAVLIYAPLVLGLLWRQRADPWLGMLLTLGALAVLLAVLGQQALRLHFILSVMSAGLVLRLPQSRPVLKAVLVTVCVIGVVVTAGMARGSAPATTLYAVVAVTLIWSVLIARRRLPVPGRFAWAQSAVATALMAASVALLAVHMVRFPARDWLPAVSQDAPVWRAVTATDGVLLCADWVRGLQLATGRAVLPSSGVDGLAYSIEGAPQLERILRDLYGVDFFNPPVQARNKGCLVPSELFKQLWENRSETEWALLAERFGFTQVLTPASWRLNLPEAARSQRQVLYQVGAPDRTEGTANQ